MLRHCLLVLLFLIRPSIAADEEEIDISEIEREHGRSMILEFEEENTGQAGSAVRKKTGASRGKQVEMIIGGQGEDGVAKRGSLVIED